MSYSNSEHLKNTLGQVYPGIAPDANQTMSKQMKNGPLVCDRFDTTHNFVIVTKSVSIELTNS